MKTKAEPRGLDRAEPAAGLLLYRYVAVFSMWRREIFRLYAETE